MDYFYSAAKHRSRGILWSIFSPARIEEQLQREIDRLRQAQAEIAKDLWTL
jgi:hypothetical protein